MRQIYYSVLDWIELNTDEQAMSVLFVLTLLIGIIIIGITTYPVHDDWVQVGNLRVHK